MYFNLNNKKQRKQFWQECENTLLKCSDNFIKENYNWDRVGKKMTPYEIFDFWTSHDLLRLESINSINTKIIETINYYEEVPYQLNGFS